MQNRGKNERGMEEREEKPTCMTYRQNSESDSPRQLFEKEMI